MAESFRIPRDGDVDLAFSGELIGFGTSEEPGRDRWFEVRVYRTEGGTYVVAGTGVSLLPSERDRNWAYVCETAQDAVDALYREDPNTGVRFLTNTARDALDEASLVDSSFRGAMTEEIA